MSKIANKLKDSNRYITTNTTPSTNSSNVVLTYASPQLQRISFNVNGKSVILPDATTMPAAGYASFIIQNIGGTLFDICDNVGNYITYLNPNETIIISLANNISSKSAWLFSQISKSNTQYFLDAGPKLTGIGINVYEPAHFDFKPKLISPTQVAGVYIQTANRDLYCVAGTINGDNIIWGVSQLVWASTVNARTSFIPLTATTGMIVASNTTPTLTAYYYEISGTTFAVSAYVTSGVSIRGACKIDNTRIFMAYSSGIRVVTQNGLGAAPSLGTGVADTLGTVCTALVDTDKVVYLDTSNRNIRIATITGTTLSAGVVLVLPSSMAFTNMSNDGWVPISGGSNYEFCYPEDSTIHILDTATIAVVSYYAGTVSLQLISVSGTTLSLTAEYVLSANTYLDMKHGGFPLAAETITWLDNSTFLISGTASDIQTSTSNTDNSIIMVKYTAGQGLSFVGSPLQTTQTNYPITNLIALSSNKVLAGNSMYNNFINVLS